MGSVQINNYQANERKSLSISVKDAMDRIENILGFKRFERHVG